ncbi:uncharacterized protein CBL_08971 [Carabus blaptoides fortunei]
MLYVIVLVLSVLGTHGTPTMSLGFPSFATFTTFSGRRDDRAVIKPFSGLRVQNDSLRMVYYNMQTVAVVELGPGKLLLNCELIEVYDPEDAMLLLNELSIVSRPLMVSFTEMVTLMSQCQLVDPPQSAADVKGNRRDVTAAAAGLTPTERPGLLANNPFTLFSGIIPGTKWCGTGDIATNYHDLGKDINMDKCCRTHDHCPLKIRAYSNRYNLTNNSLYSKSHCQCDDSLYECLKRVDTQTSNLMGNIYFNIVQVPCIEEISDGKRRFKNARNF